MRLTPDEVKTIVTVIQAAATHPVEIFLYGSRTDDQKKGGDIDLLVMTSQDEILSLTQKQLTILNRIKKNPSVGDRRIDLHFATVEMLATDPFLKQVFPTAIKLSIA